MADQWSTPASDVTADAPDTSGHPGVDSRIVAEAMPDAVVSVPTPRTSFEARLRHEMRERVGKAGESLGFDVGPEGIWLSPTGVSIGTRLSERVLTPAAAVHFVDSVAGSDAVDQGSAAVLFVVAHLESVSAFTVAIRHRGACGRVRVIALDDLERLGRLCCGDRITHQKAVALLAPSAGIDAGVLASAVARAYEPAVSER